MAFSTTDSTMASPAWMKETAGQKEERLSENSVSQALDSLREI